MLKGHQVTKRRRLAHSELSALRQAWGAVSKSFRRHVFALDPETLTLTTNLSWRDLAFVFSLADVPLRQHDWRAWAVEGRDA